MGTTDNYGLQTLGAGEAFSTNSYQFSSRDREAIDRLLRLGAETHVHNGSTLATTSPEVPPELTLDTTSGNIPAGRTVRYKFAWVDANGAESAASPEATVATPAAIASPAGPTLVPSTTGGTLLPGNYFYALTAYTGSSTSETKAGTRIFITLPTGSTTNTITLTLPSLPAGADGFNVYRRGPGESMYAFVDSVDMTVATPPTTFLDDGSTSPNCNRTPPNANMTNATNNVTIDIPGATPAVPAGLTWKIYRTYAAGDYSNSFLVEVVEETAPSSGIIVTTYVDTGISVSSGQPLSASQFTTNPGKIDLEDGNEVENNLPMGLVAGFPYTVEFEWDGILETDTGVVPWVCPFANAEIISVTAWTKFGSVPASSDVIVDVNIAQDSATPTKTTVFTTQGNRPTIPVSQQVGAPAVPDVVAVTQGDALYADIDQVGGGATPTDDGLIVQVYLFVYGFPTTTWVPG